MKRQLVAEIERFIGEYPQYKSVADFVHEATRVRMEEIRKSYMQKPLPRMEQVNFDENGVKVLDRELHRVVDVYLKPSGILCGVDRTSTCDHINFVLSLRDVQRAIRKRKSEGWKLPDI